MFAEAGGLRRVNQRQAPHAPKEHEHHQDAAGREAEAGGDPQCDAYRADGGGCFKQAGEQRQAFYAADDDPRQEKQRKIHDQDGHGLAYGFVADAAAHAFHMPAPLENGPRGQEQHGDGGGFHTACRGTGGTAHQHKENHHRLPAAAELGQVHRIEACRAQGDGLKEGRPKALDQREIAHFKR